MRLSSVLLGPVGGFIVAETILGAMVEGLIEPVGGPTPPPSVADAVRGLRQERRRIADEFGAAGVPPWEERSEEHTSELQSLMRISYAVFCLKKKKSRTRTNTNRRT